jgi:[acyl-carrier-protein] S-malonyltransferase
MKAGMLFPGQGSQFVGMGRDYYDAYPEARAVYQSADARLGFDITELCFSGDMEELTLTHNAQPAILLHSIAVLAVLEAKGITPAAVAGHSLGEFSALVAAGFVRPLDALEIVRQRGELMYEAGLERPGAMAAIIGLDQALAEECVASTDGIVVVANYNSPVQLAISGEVAAVEAASVACKEAGAKRALPLPVSGAFHSPLMEPTVSEFRKYMAKFNYDRLRVPWVANVTGAVVEDSGEVVDLLARQLSSPVRWTDGMRVFADICPHPICEVGPGKVLTGLMKRIVESRDVVPLTDAAAVEGLV